ncbi:MAG: SEC-C metal-binding domain-containing protein, partial [bacterium]|nr:SEC-C metal-binding domain-containing protein [bacterium]
SFSQDTLEKLFRVEVQEEKVVPMPVSQSVIKAQESHGSASAFARGMPGAVARQAAASGGMGLPAQAGSPPTGAGGTVQRKMPKVGRNDPCPCGSGKKYKKCHGA